VFGVVVLGGCGAAVCIRGCLVVSSLLEGG
jgi:hypothetical protein